MRLTCSIGLPLALRSEGQVFNHQCSPRQGITSPSSNNLVMLLLDTRIADPVKMAHFFGINATRLLSSRLHVIVSADGICTRINNNAPAARREMSNRGSAIKLSEGFSPAGDHDAPRRLQSGGRGMRECSCLFSIQMCGN